MRVRSYAKINWSLRITAKRSDGYHDLETLFQTISLHDVLTFRPSERLTLTCTDPTIPTDDRNLVIRAAQALGISRVSIELEKRIPAGGGLGGGSSNAAATLVALDRMFDLRRNDLPELALSLGSDVPFFLVGGTAYATGRGEALTRVASRAGIPLLLLLPRERVSTREAFSRVGRYSPAIGPDAYRCWKHFSNDFEPSVFSFHPSLRHLKDRLRDAGAEWAAMTGSGSTIVGAFADETSRDAAAATFPDVRTERCESIDAPGALIE
ncbi:MAG: 4-(cytidine 5'-diphospho)-2-C-methyl-D-erythritol kinase [Thermoanaerobaculia bacterium]